MAELSEFERTAIKACDGLPTAWLDRGFVRELYALSAILALCDRIGDRADGDISFPAGWWDAHIRGQLDTLNRIALSDQSYSPPSEPMPSG